MHIHVMVVLSVRLVLYSFLTVKSIALDVLAEILSSNFKLAFNIKLAKGGVSHLT